MRIYGVIILLLVQLGLCAQRTQVLGFRNHGQEQKFYALDFRFNPPKKVLLVDELAIMGQGWGDELIAWEVKIPNHSSRIWTGTSFIYDHKYANDEIEINNTENLNYLLLSQNLSFEQNNYQLMIPTFLVYNSSPFEDFTPSMAQKYVYNKAQPNLKFSFFEFEACGWMTWTLTLTSTHHRFFRINKRWYFRANAPYKDRVYGGGCSFVLPIDSKFDDELMRGIKAKAFIAAQSFYGRGDLDYFRDHQNNDIYSLESVDGPGSDHTSLHQIHDTGGKVNPAISLPYFITPIDRVSATQYETALFCGSENRFLWRFPETKEIKHSTLWLYERASPESVPQIVRELPIPESPGETRRLSSFRSNTAGTYAYVAVKSHLEGKDSQEHRLFQFDLRNNTPPVLMHRFATDLKDTLLLPVVYRLPNGKIYIGFHSRHYPNTDRKRGYNIIHEPDRPFPDCRLELDEDWVDMLGDYGEIHFDGWDSKIMGFKEEIVCNGQLKLINQSDTSLFKEFVWYSEQGDSVSSTAHDLHATLRLSKPGKQLIFLKGISEEGYIQWFERTVDYPEAYWLPEPRFSLTDSTGCQWVEQQVTDLTAHPEEPEYTATIYWGDGHSVQFIPGDPPNEQVGLRHIYTQEGTYELYMVLAKNQCRDTFAQELKIEILPAPRPGIFTDTLRLCQLAAFDVGRLYSDSLRSLQWQLIGPDNRDTTFVFEPALSQQEKAPIWRMNGLTAGEYTLKQSLIGASSCINTDSMRLRVMPDLPNELPVFSHIQANKQQIRIYTDTLSGLLMRLLPDDLLSKNGRFDLPANDTLSRAVELRFENHCAEMAEEGSNAYLPAITGQMTQVGENHITYYSTGLPTEQTYLSIQSRRGITEVMVPEGSKVLHIDVYDPDNENTRCYRLMQKHPDGDTSFSREICLDVPFLLFLPNAFSPDGDGLNDVWKPVTAGAEWVHLRIYDRWGGLLYDEKALSPEWDGQNAQAGMYAYTLEVRSAKGESFFRNGCVQLVR